MSNYLGRQGVRAVLVVGIIAAWVARESPAAPPALPVRDVGSRRQLFTDRWLIDRMRGTRLHLHSPDRREVVFTFDAPWEGPQSAYVTVLQDGPRYRMYYRGGGDLTREVTCLAESTDGLRWTRPQLGLFAFNGSRENNILWMPREKGYAESHNFTPFIDTNPACPSNERYKAVALAKFHDEKIQDRRKMLVALVSPDGIHWRRLKEEPILREGSFDSQNVAFWDSLRGHYVCYSRGGRDGIRSILRSTSRDFRRWSAQEWIDLGPGKAEHLYTNAILPYFRAPSLYLGFPMRFVPERRKVGAEERPVDALSDAVLISSRDGEHWTRLFREAFIRPGPDPANWGNGHGNTTPAWGLLPTPPGELSVYWAEGYGAVPRLRRGGLRLDGFVSIQAPESGGEWITHPLRFQGRQLVLNAATSAIGSLKVEVQDAAGRPLAGYRLADCKEIYGDDVGRVVEWQGNPDLSMLAGRPLRLRFVMRDADLYSLAFQP